MLRRRLGRLRAARDESGAIALISALVAMTLLVVCAFVVNLGGTWTRRGQLQVQADKAALFAAEALPATDDTTKLNVARRAAYYIACHPTVGQSALNPGIPACPSSTSAPTLNSYAQSMLAQGLVNFPSSTQVQVITPTSRVEFAFAGAVGVKETDQSKSATATVSSPGSIVPVGLSLNCIASVVNNAGLGSSINGILPISYIVPGTSSSSGSLNPDTEPAFEAWTGPYTGTNASASVTLGNPVNNQGVLTLAATSPALLPSITGLLGDTKLAFKRGTTTVEANASNLTLAGGGTITASIPATVLATPGIWHIKVRLDTASLALAGINPKWSDGEVTLAIYPSQSTVVGRLTSMLGNLLDLNQLLACGRLLDSPRPQDGGTPTLTRNLQEGLDHALTPNQSLVTALGGTNLNLNGSAANVLGALGSGVAGILADPTYGLTGCGGTTYNRLDTAATYTATLSGGAPANCVKVNSSASAGQEFTDGFLKDTASTPTEPGYGRLSCNRPGACGAHTTVLPGFSGTYNNDSFADFLKDGSGTLLDSNLAFALDTYLVPSLPVVTPSAKIKQDIYSSPRFFWAPVMTTVDLNQTSQSYPILTFRPVFIDNDTAPDLKILGLNAGGVVDGLGAALQASVSQALDVVRTSFGLLGTALDAAISALHLDTIINSLDAGNVNTALTNLGAALNLDMGSETAGLVIQNKQLKAAKFMTIAPDALPPVSTSYTGPVTDYLGVGPKIVRLVG